MAIGDIEPGELARRCQIHSAKMDEEGHYTTANVLFLAANEIFRLEKIVAQMTLAAHSA